MGASASLSPTDPRTEPGGTTVVEVRVRNNGGVVDQFTFSVVGPAAAWATFEPPTLSLFPGADGTTTLRLSPPRSHDVPAGQVPFGVKVESKEDPKGSVVEEGVLEIGEFSDVFAELVPRTARGRGSARYDFALDNRGNTRLNTTLAATDPNDALSFDLRPAGLVADPNTAVFTKVKAKARKRFLRGTPKTHPFQVAVRSDGAQPLVVDGTLLQEPVLPPWLLKALALVLAALLAIWALSRKAAKDAVDEAVAPMQGQAAQLAAGQKALEQAINDRLPPPAEPGATASPSPILPIQPPTPVARRLSVANNQIAQGATVNSAMDKVPDKQVLHLTDLVLENPQGDSGTLVVLRGTTPLLELRLDNFRDFDYHFVTPIQIPAGDQLVLQARCDAPGPFAPPAKLCKPGMVVIGFFEHLV